MRKIREVLRLKAAGFSDRKIASVIGSARSTVQECVRRAHEAGLIWPLAEELDESALHAQLYRRSVPLSQRPQPDFAQLHAELSRPGVTRLLLWQEYKAVQPDGWQYSVFCDQYRRWLSTQELVLRQNHAPGEKLFVDYAGQTVAITDPRTGEQRAAQIFVAVLGCSNFTYAEATWTQALPDWLGSHVRALAFIGGVPTAIVPDNLRSGVTRAHRCEPEINPSYQDFAEHYGLAILPARVRKRFLELEQSALRPLPARGYEFGEWKKAKVHPDYHIEVNRAYYSVPFGLIGRQLDVRLSAGAVEVFHDGKLVAAHARASERGRRSTRDAHRPQRHVAVIENSLARVLERAAAIGAATLEVLRQQAARRKHPEETLRSAQGILRLASDFTPGALERACQRAVALKSYSYRAVRTLIETPATTAAQPALDLAHENVRGPEYFQ